MTTTPKGNPDKRLMVTVRFKPVALEAVEQAAARDSRNRADEIRLLLAYAVQNMPKGWTP